MQWCHGTFRVTSSHPSCGGGVGLGLDMARAGARQHGHPTVSAEDLLSVNRGKKKKLVTELIVRLATPGVDTVVFSTLLGFLSTAPSPLLSTNAVQLTVPVGDDSQLMSGGSCGPPVPWLSTMQYT